MDPVPDPLLLRKSGSAGDRIRGFDTFSKCKSRGGGYRVSHGSPLKMSTVKYATTGLTYVKLKDIASGIRNQWQGRIQNVEVFGLLRD